MTNYNEQNNTNVNNTNVNNQNGNQAVYKKRKQLLVTTMEATIMGKPRLKEFKRNDGQVDNLYETNCLVHSAYERFTTKIYSKEIPNYSEGEIVTIEIQSTDYKLRFTRNDQQG